MCYHTWLTQILDPLKQPLHKLVLQTLSEGWEGANMPRPWSIGSRNSMSKGLKEGKIWASVRVWKWPQWQEHGGMAHPPHVLSVQRYGKPGLPSAPSWSPWSRSSVQIHAECPSWALEATMSSSHTMVMGGPSVHEFMFTNNLEQEIS